MEFFLNQKFHQNSNHLIVLNKMIVIKNDDDFLRGLISMGVFHDGRDLLPAVREP